MQSVKLSKMNKAPSDFVLSDLKTTSLENYGHTAVALRLGYGQDNQPVIRMGEINAGEALEMYLDYETIMELHSWLSAEIKRLENN